MSEEVVDAEIVEENGTPEGPLKIAVVGRDTALSTATARAFAVPRGVEVETYTSEPEDIDACVEYRPNVVFWCDEIDVKRNDSLDDSALLAAIQKLVRITGAGVCIRTTINIETYERLIMSLTREIFDNKIIYMPDLTDSANVADIITQDVQVIGGSGAALEAHMGVLRNMSWFSTGKLVTGAIPEVVFAKLAVSGYRLVQQTFFDELHDAVMDMKNANPMVVNNIVSQTLGSGAVPSFVTERDRTDSRIFAGATDTLTLIDKCLEK